MGVIIHMSRIIVRIKSGGTYKATNMVPSMWQIFNKCICCTYIFMLKVRPMNKIRKKALEQKSEQKPGIIIRQHFREATWAQWHPSHHPFFFWKGPVVQGMAVSVAAPPAARIGFNNMGLALERASIGPQSLWIGCFPALTVH